MKEEELKELLKTLGKRTPLWEKAFSIYNEHNAHKLSMNCKPCYGKVYNFIKYTLTTS